MAYMWSLSKAGALSLAKRMFGAMTVARFLMSILDPDSSSTWWNELAHFRKQNRISSESRWHLGSRQHARCRHCLLLSSSGILAAAIHTR